MVYWADLETENVLQQQNILRLRIASVSSIHSARIAVPFDVEESVPVRWLLVEPRADWLNIFEEVMGQTIANHKEEQKRQAEEQKRPAAKNNPVNKHNRKRKSNHT